MSAKTWMILALLVLSLAAGVALGEWFFRLYLRAMPAVVLSDFNTQSSRIAHWLYGACAGVVLFVWSLIGMAVNGMTRRKAKPTGV